MLNFDERTRAYIYRVVLAVLPLLVFYGLVGEAEAAEYALVAAAVLGVGADALAVKNTPSPRGDA